MVSTSYVDVSSRATRWSRRAEPVGCRWFRLRPKNGLLNHGSLINQPSFLDTACIFCYKGSYNVQVNDKAPFFPFMPRRINPKPTMKEVAALASVSVQTVSFVVNANPIITPETRQRVLNAIQQLGYTPDASARSLRSGHSRVLGLLIPDVHNPHFWAILDGAEQEARAHGYSLILATTSMQRERERQAFDALARQHLDGLILLFTYPEDFTADIDRLRQKRLPIVVDGTQYRDVDRVWFHYRAAARELMDHLFSLGHRRIAFIQGVGRLDYQAGKIAPMYTTGKWKNKGYPPPNGSLSRVGIRWRTAFLPPTRFSIDPLLPPHRGYERSDGLRSHAGCSPARLARA